MIYSRSVHFTLLSSIRLCSKVEFDISYCIRRYHPRTIMNKSFIERVLRFEQSKLIYWRMILWIIFLSTVFIRHLWHISPRCKWESWVWVWCIWVQEERTDYTYTQKRFLEVVNKTNYWSNRFYRKKEKTLFHVFLLPNFIFTSMCCLLFLCNCFIRNFWVTIMKSESKKKVLIFASSSLDIWSIV